MLIRITQVWVHYFKSFNRVQSTQDEKEHFIKGNELKLTHIELFSFLFFKRVLAYMLKHSNLCTAEHQLTGNCNVYTECPTLSTATLKFIVQKVGKFLVGLNESLGICLSK